MPQILNMLRTDEDVLKFEVGNNIRAMTSHKSLDNAV